MSNWRFADEERPRRRAPWGVLALVLLTGLALVRSGSGQVDSGPPQPASAATAERRTPEQARAEAVRPLPFSPVERVRVPAIRVDAPVAEVGLDAEGWIDAPPPEEANLAGWFTGAAAPGERGTAVVVGHVDNARGPAVFYGLGSLHEGHHVEIRRKDGRTAVFRVYGVEVFAKSRFPGRKVYRSRGTPELRLITCGGHFSKRDGYEGNVVAFARLVSTR
ncbi:class F sortase [Streptomyces sp. NPDC002790]|uniref:class F sortase n=1 Tax=Streptomyces sp. NPDC002790 TaxID=3154431 RepID=UPI0033207E9E